MKYLFLLLFILFLPNTAQSQLAEEIHDPNLDAKISSYDSIIKTKPSADAYFHRGYLNSLNKNYDKALSDYNKAILSDSTNHEFFFNRAYLKDLLKDYQGALIDYSKVVALDKKNFKAFYNRAYIKQYRFNDVEGAFKDYTKTIEIDPKNGFAYEKRGFLKMKAEKHIEAIKDFDKAIALNPTDYLSFAFRGYCKSVIGDKTALNDFNRVLILHPSAQAYVDRAAYYLIYDRKRDYCSDLRKAVDSENYEPAKALMKKYCK
ncbi:tetratricopeptide repeat protein [Flavobacterium sp.]|uniref:tetratricopeptide repeat protein n=1 Tax=Flavobacterium sp. TaxID=239 RepID=UPI003D6BDA38